MRTPFREIAYRGKQLVLRVSMAGELNMLAHELNRFSERNRHYRDFTLNSLSYAIREIIACFPVYRTYVNDREPVERPRPRLYRARRARGQAAQPDAFTARLRLRARPAAEEGRLHSRGRTRRAHALRRQVPAGDQPGDRQGNRGHRPLHLQPPRLA